MNTVEQFYDQDEHNEWSRFDRHRTEFAVNLRALSEFLPPAPVQILDVGGGPGRYAIELTKRGYPVTLLDLAQRNLERAQANAEVAGIALAGVQHGNALDLTCFADNTYDAVLLMGPLYHLFTEQDRVQAVVEARRVLLSDADAAEDAGGHVVRDDVAQRISPRRAPVSSANITTGFSHVTRLRPHSCKSFARWSSVSTLSRALPGGGFI